MLYTQCSVVPVHNTIDDAPDCYYRLCAHTYMYIRVVLVLVCPSVQLHRL